jgi:LysM repeat protein
MVPFARKCLLSGIALIGLIPALQLMPSMPAHAASYVVQPNETLSGIALRFHTTVGQLARLNGIADPDRLRVGQVLTVPDGPGYGYGHGDEGYGAGQVGQIPAPGYATPFVVQTPVAGSLVTGAPAGGAPYGTSMYYTVVPGDTLSGLSARFGVSLAALAAANGISRPDMVRVGQRLLVPGRTSGRQTFGNQAPFLSRASAITPATGTIPVVPLATATPGSSLAAPLSGSTDVATLLTQVATAYGLDPALVKAVAWQESGWRMVVARDGGIGVMQLMPATAAWVGPALLGRTIDPYNLQDNIQAGVALLAYYMRQYGNVQQALAAYNEGPTNLARGLLATTAHYVSDILALEGRFAS